jgi:hypothetical protein
MPLLALWTSNPAAIGESTIEQIVTIAGDGNLRDGSPCSQELREYLAQCQSNKLETYVEHCLSSGFARSGMVLQDLINELGRRLDYLVENGRYQGTRSTIGYDGIWISPEAHTIIVEVKTTDAYRISLDTLAGYRDKLIVEGKVTNRSSILIVVGRDDTGELEAQIRGSRHAWDIRLISADALLQLVQLKENSDSPDTGRKIRSLLAPMEYTRLDNLIDVLFTTATDVEATVVETAATTDELDATITTAERTAKSGWEFTDFAVLDRKRAQIVDAMGTKLGGSYVASTNTQPLR